MISDLYCGDCLEEMNKIEDGSVDAIITDPPYGTTACKWDTVIPFEPMWNQLKRIIKKNGAIVLFGSEPFSSYLRMSNIKQYKYDWVWNKKRPTGFALVKKQPMRLHETISIFYIAQPTYNRQFSEKPIGNQRPNKVKTCIKSPYSCSDSAGNIQPKFSKDWDDTKKNPVSILEFSNPNYNKGHPTQKPVALMEYLIKTYTNENETALDFCIGSGTTAIACERLKRKWIGIEIEEKYCEIAAKRIEENLTVMERIERSEKGITKKTGLLF